MVLSSVCCADGLTNHYLRIRLTKKSLLRINPKRAAHVVRCGLWVVFNRTNRLNDMDLSEQVLKAEDNLNDAIRDLQNAQQDIHPANVAPVLAAQAVARDRQTSYLTMQTWMRNSDQDFTDVDRN